MSARARVDFERGSLSVHLEIPDGPIVALSGPNGSGKTTMIRCLAGLEPEAAVDWETGPPRSIGYLPQRVMLYPSMTVEQNIASSLRFAGQREVDRRVAELVEAFGLTDVADRRPDVVSGGQRQRGGLARALAARPALVLLDEPFSAIDAATRDDVRGVVAAELESSTSWCVMATHDHRDIEVLGAIEVALSGHSGRVA